VGDVAGRFPSAIICGFGKAEFEELLGKPPTVSPLAPEIDFIG
jgi:hypothetical protein